VGSDAKVDTYHHYYRRKQLKCKSEALQVTYRLRSVTCEVAGEMACDRKQKDSDITIQILILY
jgi:hypothetical protein